MKLFLTVALSLVHINNAFALSYQSQNLDLDLKIIEENTKELSKEDVEKIKQSHINKLKRIDKLSLSSINNNCKEDLLKICSQETNKIDCMHFNLNKIQDKKCKQNISMRVGKYPILKESALINGIKFPKGSKIIQKEFKTDKVIRVGTSSFVKDRNIFYSNNIFMKNGKIRQSKLAFPQRVNGILYGNNDFVFDLNENNIVTVGILGEDTVINNILAPKGSSVRRFDSGKIKKLTTKNPITIYGVKFKANQSLEFDKNGILEFHLSMKENEDAPVIKVNDYELTRTKFKSNIKVYPSGKLKYGILAKKHVINGQEIPDYTLISLSEDGKLLKSIKLEKPAPKVKEGDSFKIPLISMIIDGEVDMWTNQKQKYPSLVSVESALHGLHENQYVTKIINANTKITAIKKLEDRVYLFKDDNNNIFRQLVFNNKPYFYTNKCDRRDISKCQSWANILASCKQKTCTVNITVPLKGKDNMIMYKNVIYDNQMYERSKRGIINILDKYKIKYKTLPKSNTLVVFGNSIDFANLLINSNNLYFEYLKLID